MNDSINKIKQFVYRILRKSEKYTQTDMVYLTKQGFWVTLLKFIIGLNVLITALAFANLLPKEIFGQYKYALSIFAILKMFSLEGMSRAVTRAVAKGKEHVIHIAIKSKIIWGIIGTVFSFILAIYYYITGNSALAAIFIIVGCFIPIFDTFTLYASYFNGKKLFATGTKFTAAVEILTTVILVITLFLTNDLIIILLAYFLPYTIIRLVVFIITWRHYGFNINDDNETINYGKQLSLMTIAPTIANNLDRIFLWHLLTPISVAVFSFAMAIPDEIRTIIKSIDKLAFPKISEKEEHLVKKTLPTKIFKAMAALIPVVIIYIIVAPHLFRILFPQYTEAVFYSQVFSFVIILSPQVLFVTYFEAFAKKKEQYYFKILSPISRIVSFIILIPLLGILGAIISIIISRLFSFGLGYYLFKKS